jgi:hypothetical protein
MALIAESTALHSGIGETAGWTTSDRDWLNGGGLMLGFLANYINVRFQAWPQIQIV